MSDHYYAVDPAFDDNSEWVSCDACEREYDRREYNSDTCVECENKLTIKEREGKAMKDYGFILDGGGLICPKCADNPLYKGELDRVDQEGYPDGYTCDECGEVSK
jgi:hypothetical protein